MKKIKLIILFFAILASMVFFASCDQDIDQTCDHEYETTSIGADCEHGAMNTKVCVKCGDRTDTYTPPSGHSFEKTVIAPTCSDSGYTEYKCACGFSYKAEIVSAKGHYYKETVTSPTCTTAGYTTYTCRNCAHTYIGATVAPVDHDLECKKHIGCSNHRTWHSKQLHYHLPTYRKHVDEVH